MPVLKLTKGERRKMLVIVTCIVLATIAWIFMALNGKYVYNAKTVMIYKNFPKSRAFHPLQSDTLDLQVEGTGWQLIFARLRVNPSFININLSKLNSQDYVLLDEQIGAMNRQIETAQKVISADPDTLYFDFSRSYEKKIPVKLVSDLKFAPQFSLSAATRLQPAFVTVRGPKELLDDLKYWTTDTLKLTAINGGTTRRLQLAKNALKNINVFPTSVDVKLTAEEFTEKTVDVPLKQYGNVDYNDVSVFPKKVSITFLVALSAYDKIGADYIEAGVDLTDWKYKGHSRLTVRLKRFPEYCKLVKITPSIVDFIIEK